MFIVLTDVRMAECVASWPAHNGDVYTVKFTPDEAACHSMGADGKVRLWLLSCVRVRVTNAVALH